VTVQGSKIRFCFRGKSGIQHRVGLYDRRLAALVQRCQDLPGQSLFQYLDDDGEPRTIDSGDVNDYLREIAGDDFTAKDFRTWAGTLIAARALRDLGPAATVTEAKRKIGLAIEEVSRELRNTKAVCRKCYIHPAVTEAYLDGSFFRVLRRRRRKTGDAAPSLGPEEAGLLSFLQSRLSHETNGRA
jgi:DNA topoisomerase-1